MECLFITTLTGMLGPAYGITGVPETFIINKNGIVAEKIIGPP